MKKSESQSFSDFFIQLKQKGERNDGCGSALDETKKKNENPHITKILTKGTREEDTPTNLLAALLGTPTSHQKAQAKRPPPAVLPSPVPQDDLETCPPPPVLPPGHPPQGHIFPQQTALSYTVPPENFASFPQPRTDSVAVYPKDFSHQMSNDGPIPHAGRTIAVSRNFIGYIFRMNVRVIHQLTGGRELLRCSETPADVQFSSRQEVDLLAVAGVSTGITIWRLSVEDSDPPEEMQSGTGTFSKDSKELPPVQHQKIFEIQIPAKQVYWNPSDPSSFALIRASEDGQNVANGAIVTVAGWAETPQSPTVRHHLSGQAATLTDFCYITLKSKEILLSADSIGKVTVSCCSSGILKVFSPFELAPPQPLSRVIYLGENIGGGSIYLLAATKGNTLLSLWEVPLHKAEFARLIQKLELSKPDNQTGTKSETIKAPNNQPERQFFPNNYAQAKGPDGSKGFSFKRSLQNCSNNPAGLHRMKIDVDASMQFIVVADTQVEGVYTLQIRESLEQSEPRFIYVRPYHLKDTIQHLSVMIEKREDHGHTAELDPVGLEIQVVCTQKRSVQIYSLPLVECTWPPLPEDQPAKGEPQTPALDHMLEEKKKPSPPLHNGASAFFQTQQRPGLMSAIPASEMHSLDQLEAHVPSQESGEKEQASSFGSTNPESNHEEDIVALTSQITISDQNQQGGERSTVLSVQTPVGNNQANSETPETEGTRLEGSESRAQETAAASQQSAALPVTEESLQQEVGSHTTETQQGGGEPEPEQANPPVSLSLSLANSTTGEPSSSLSREGSTAELSGAGEPSSLEAASSMSSGRIGESGGVRRMAASDHAAEDSHPISNNQQSLHQRIRSSGDISAGEPHRVNGLPSSASQESMRENRRGKSTVPPTPIEHLPAALQQLMRSMQQQGEDPDRSAGFAPVSGTAGQDSSAPDTLQRNRSSHSHLQPHKQPAAHSAHRSENSGAETAAGQAPEIHRIVEGCRSDNTDGETSSVMEWQISHDAPNEGHLKLPAPPVSGISASQMQELKDHIARCIASRMPPAPNNPPASSDCLAPEAQLNALKGMFFQELASLRASVIDSLSQFIELQSETLHAQLVQLASELTLSTSLKEKDEEDKSKELNLQIGSLLKKEVQTTLVPALARIVMHTMDNNLLKPVQNTLTTQLEPRLDQAIRSNVQIEVQKQSNLLSTQLTANTDRLIESVVQGCGAPVHSMFKRAFKDMLIPAFQKATNNMFEQINHALEKGLADCPALGPVKVPGMEKLGNQVAQLTGSVGELARAVTKVTDEVRRLQDQVSFLASNMTTLAEEQARASQAAQTAAEAAVQAAAATRFQETSKENPKPHVQQLLGEEKFEEACTAALAAKDIEVLIWLLENLDKDQLFGADPPLLSQTLLLCLLQQVGYNLEHQTTLKLDWLREIALVLNPLDPEIEQHAPQVLAQMKQNIEKLKPILTSENSSDLSNLKLLAHIINSHVSSCI